MAAKFKPGDHGPHPCGLATGTLPNAGVRAGEIRRHRGAAWGVSQSGIAGARRRWPPQAVSLPGTV